MHDNNWTRLCDAKTALVEAGAGQADLLRLIGYQGAWRGLVASGFHHAHLYRNDGSARDDEQSSSPDRTRIPTRIWHIVRSQERLDGESGISLHVDWLRGSLTVTYEMDDGRTAQETWDSVCFDTAGLEGLAGEIRSALHKGELTVMEVARWISDDCTTQNSKTAWTLFKRRFGNRAGKKSVFIEIWKEQTGGRARGRPKRQ